MSVFNGGRDLPLAVESLLGQSFADWELLLIDDGSTDGAVGRLPTQMDRRIRIVADGKNRGLAARLNQAVQMARGDYVARMDHDDVAHPERLARQVAFLDAHPDIDLLDARCVAMSEAERVVGTLPVATEHTQICRRPWLGFYLAHPTWMGRTDWFRRNLYRDPGPYRCEDQELLLRTYKESRFAALPEALLAYRVRRPPLSVLLRTRRALAREQISYFLSRGEAGFAALSLAAAIARVGSDLLASLLRGREPTPTVMRPATIGEASEWDEMIVELRHRAGPGGEIPPRNPSPKSASQ